MNPPSKQPTVPPTLALLFGILAVSTASIFIRFAQQSAPSLVIAAFRLVLASIVLTPFALIYHRSELSALTRRQLVLLVFSGIFLAIHFGSWISSLEFTSVASSVVLVTTTPLWVAILSPFFLHEKLSRLVWFGLFIAMVGGVVIGLQESCTFQAMHLSCSGFAGFASLAALKGNALALIGAFMAAGYIVIGRQVRGNLSLVSYTFVVYGTAAVVLLATVLLLRLPLTGYPAQVYLLFLALALVPQLLGHSTFNWALRYLPAAYVSIALLGEPIGTTILATLFLREPPSVAELFGGALILFGIYLASQRSTSSPA